MMQTLGEFLSPEAGQARRKWLDESLGQFIPPELRGWVGAGAELNPVTNVERAGTAARRMTAPGISGWDRMAAAGDMATNMGAVLAPVAVTSKTGVPAANAIVEALTAASPMRGAADEFLLDEFGGVGFRAYHGSPHDFDRFSLDKIGTGEGAQAYGHGLYFADNEAVARAYRDQLTNRMPQHIEGNLVASGISADLANTYARWAAETKGGRGSVDDFEAIMRTPSPSPTINAFRHKMLEEMPKLRAATEGLNGRMYEVQINADPADFLDWDKPLSEQPAAIRALASNAPLDGATGPTKAKLRAFQSGAENPSMGIVATGQDLHRALSAYGENSPAATEAFRSAGIPGIRYLDAGSRGAGDGSRNYVVFDDKLIEILRKYGLAGAVPMGALLSQPQDPMGSYLEAQ